MSLYPYNPLRDYLFMHTKWYIRKYTEKIRLLLMRENADGVNGSEKHTARYDYHYLIERYKRAVEYGSRPIFFKNNVNYSYAKYPFITEKDVYFNRFVVREFRLRNDKLRYARRAGLKKKDWYDPNSPIIASYSTLEAMAKDNWYADIDYVPAELNVTV